MNNQTIDNVFKILEEEMVSWQEPVVSRVSREKDPFKILISTVLSLRTKDKTTGQAFNRLFNIASTPEKLLELPLSTIEKAIYPVGFYKSKARNIIKISKIILEDYGGRVPGNMDKLLNLPGVGRKTANLVIILGFNGMGICVDTHVHRITNRWGYVSTRSPNETEMKLREVLPKRYWRRINDLLVPYGQNLCMPVSPYCSRCKLCTYCDQIGVSNHR
ncbi:MAG: endonuclease III [Deltaproteobacteria bacterium]|nr:endonuclease III [Deltaproteobacteria bacterium]